MARSVENIGPFSMAVLLHIVLLGSMVIAFDFSRHTPFTPLAIQATLVQEIPESRPPPVVKKQPEPEPEPVVEEEPLPPDNSAELRREAEAEKRRLDALIEQERLDKLKQQELEAEKKREREEEDRKKREEEEKEKKRLDAERKRQEDIERQRLENERLRRELEDDQRAQEIEDEARRIAAATSPAMDAYKFAIAQKIRRNWSVPASAAADTLCTVRVRQTRGGDILSVNIVSCNGDDAVERSIEAAVRRSSPLPEPSNPDLFSPNLELNLRPEQQN